MGSYNNSGPLAVSIRPIRKESHVRYEHEHVTFLIGGGNIPIISILREMPDQMGNYRLSSRIIRKLFFDVRVEMDRAALSATMK